MIMARFGRTDRRPSCRYEWSSCTTIYIQCGSPKLFHIKGIRSARAKGELVRRATLCRQWRVGCGAGEPFVFHQHVGGPLRIEEVLDLATGTVGIQTAGRVVDGQGGQARNGRAKRLCQSYSEIRTHSSG